MAHLTTEEIKEIAMVNVPNCVSIYIPTHIKGQAVTSGHDQANLKNHLNEAREMLMNETGMGKKEAEDYLAAGYQLLEDNVFWHYMEKSFAVFIREGFIQTVKLPFKVPASTYVANHFDILPLTPSLSGDGRFYILSLSLNQTRLFSCDRESIHEIHIKSGIPVPEGETAPALKASFHGSGDRMDDRKVEMEQFLNELDKQVYSILHADHAPLLIASVDYIHSIYTKVSNYKYIFSEYIKENPDHESSENLHEKGWEIIKDHFGESRKSDINKLNEGLAKGNATSDLLEILTHSETGKVESMFVNEMPGFGHLKKLQADLKYMIAEKMGTLTC